MASDAVTVCGNLVSQHVHSGGQLPGHLLKRNNVHRADLVHASPLSMKRVNPRSCCVPRNRGNLRGLRSPPPPPPPVHSATNSFLSCAPCAGRKNAPRSIVGVASLARQIATSSSWARHVSLRHLLVPSSAGRCRDGQVASYSKATAHGDCMRRECVENGGKLSFGFAMWPTLKRTYGSPRGGRVTRAGALDSQSGDVNGSIPSPSSSSRKSVDGGDSSAPEGEALRTGSLHGEGGSVGGGGGGLSAELQKAVNKTASTFAPRASAPSKNPAVKGTALYSIFGVQGWLCILLGGALSFNLIFPSDHPDVWRLIGMWSVWMFTIPSWRARDCTKEEKAALNLLFLLIPVINIAIPIVWTSFPAVFSADIIALFLVYAWKLNWFQNKKVQS